MKEKMYLWMFSSYLCTQIKKNLSPMFFNQLSRILNEIICQKGSSNFLKVKFGIWNWNCIRIEF